MGWASVLFCNINFNKETYNSKYEVENRIEELKDSIKNAKEIIKNLVVMTEPKKFCPEDNDPLFWMQHTADEWIEILEEDTIELYKLNLLLDNWENCHNREGLAIYPPDFIHFDTAFLSGDFIKSTKYPD